VFSRQRSASLPNVASAHEQGIKDFEAISWNAIFLPRHVPAAILHKLHNATVSAMDTPSLQDRLKQLGATVVPAARRSPDYLHAFVASEIAKWAGTIKASGVSMD
jgi:tripartite-type tricarboxylate transporter receptor subunit TctC